MTTTELVAKTSSMLERRTSRRGFLLRTVVAGSAVVVAPVRFLLRPGTAMAAITCSSCSGSSKCCSDGFTEFCCSVDSASNSCPSGSYYGGWWRCRNYTGSHICKDYNTRYYLDCNRLPGYSCSRWGGKCACGGVTSACSCRHSCCAVFRYGNCNANRVGYATEVVCRVVRCRNPSILGLGCSSSGTFDAKTCTHEACCKCGACW